MLVGREYESDRLRSLLDSDKSEFVAVYGRRRVGKTYLIRETFNYHFAFQHSGLSSGDMQQQIDEFRNSMMLSGWKEKKRPENWYDAFHQLAGLLAASKDDKKVVFIDEMPWMDTPRSNFISALEHFGMVGRVPGKILSLLFAAVPLRGLWIKSFLTMEGFIID